MSDTEYGTREMRIRVYVYNPETREKRTVSEQVVRRRPGQWYAETLAEQPCKCPKHPGGVLLDLRGGV